MGTQGEAVWIGRICTLLNVYVPRLTDSTIPDDLLSQYLLEQIHDCLVRLAEQGPRSEPGSIDEAKGKWEEKVKDGGSKWAKAFMEHPVMDRQETTPREEPGLEVNWQQSRKRTSEEE